LCTLKDLKSIPSSRDFGIQDQNDIMEERHKVQLEKILPIINGLLFLSTENRQKVLKEGVHIKALFDIFKY
jgi:hypothetical protein